MFFFCFFHWALLANKSSVSSKANLFSARTFGASQACARSSALASFLNGGRSGCPNRSRWPKVPDRGLQVVMIQKSLALSEYMYEAKEPIMTGKSSNTYDSKRDQTTLLPSARVSMWKSMSPLLLRVDRLPLLPLSHCDRVELPR
jgi:hypothetical protein